jgi:hypothetical protein
MLLYHFTSKEHGLSDIRNRWLKVARINDLNDPFDFLCLRSNDHTVRKVLRDLRTLVSQYNGLICFSKSFRSPVQWSHYADGHKGVCFQFSVPKKLVRFVDYQDQRPVVDLGAARSDLAGGWAAFQKLLTVKYKEWDYE